MQRARSYAVPSITVALVVCAVLGFESYSTRVLAQKPSSQVMSDMTATDRDGRHDFDFEFGSWKAHLRRRLNPQTGSNTWVEYDGTSIVRKVWEGRANLGEFNVENGQTRLQGLSLRLYNPQSHQWNISWANSNDGSLTTPMIGGFKNGRGEFYDQEIYQGKSIYARFIFSDITPASFQLEQAYSADGGKTWEPNWIATFTRQE